MSEKKWTKEQQEAISARDSNLLVAAAAGAGKTAVLVERIIQKITAEKEAADIDRLLVVTFTNAAAAEMRERIAQAIAAFLEKEPGNRKIQRQLILLNKASITTIHAFCLEVIRNHFQYLDLDPGFRIGDPTESELLKIEVLNEFFEDIYVADPPDQEFYDLLESYGGNRDDQLLQDLVLNLYNFVQSHPWPEDWLRKMSGCLNISDEIDFAQTPWGEVLLSLVRVELSGLVKKMEKATDLLEGSAGLEKYYPVFQEEKQRLQQIAGLFPYNGNPGWDELYHHIQEFPFNRLPVVSKEADQVIQEKVKAIRDGVKKNLQKMKEDIFIADSREITADLQALYPLMSCLCRLIEEFGRRYAQAKKKKSLLDFNDLEHYCLQILTAGESGENLLAGSGEASPADPRETPSAVALAYRQRFEEILVDEYQDSNLVQEMIIRMIARREPCSNVFMVGDVKQSIYRFRQARPELFLQKYHSYSPEAGSPCRKIMLSRNFRSREEIIQAVNCIFAQIMSGPAGEMDYTPEEFLRPGASFPEDCGTGREAGGRFEFHLLETQAGTEDPESGESVENGENKDVSGERAKPDEILDNIQLEARLAARCIQELIRPDQEGKSFVVFDQEKKAYRPVRYKDIVILLRTTKNWAEIFREELTLRGIPVFADTGSGFFQTPEVQIVLSLLQIIDNPLQDIPLLAVLRSPLFAFSSDELAELRLAKRRGYFYEALQAAAGSADLPEKSPVSATTGQKAKRFLVKLEKWRDESFYLSTDRLLWQIYQETGYYGIAAALPNGEQRQANLRMLFERARQYEETGLKGLFNFINFIEKLKSSRGDMGSAKILGENDDVVRIMSIHKSKGLEFPVVILAGTGKKFNFQDMNRSVLFHQDLGLGPDVVDYKLRLAYPSLAKVAIREKLKLETLAEEMRILYVALTRAREKLILTGTVKDAAGTLETWEKIRENSEGTRLAPYDVLRGVKYLDWLGSALTAHPDWPGLLTIWSRDEVQAWEAENRPEENMVWLDGLDSADPGETGGEIGAEGASETLRQEIDRRLAWQYPYAEITGIPAKVSVTELKRRFQEESAVQSGIPPLPPKMKRPLFLEGKKAFTAAEIGTINHFVLQHLRFGSGELTRENIAEQIETMVAANLLTAKQAEVVDTRQIERFLLSEIGRRMTAAQNIRRELPFNMEIPCGELYGEAASERCQGETVLLQGVIDCCFEENGQLVLIDYKTDAVGAAGLEKLKDQYKYQIAYYALALEKLTGKKVKEKYVYLLQSGEALAYH